MLHNLLPLRATNISLHKDVWSLVLIKQCQSCFLVVSYRLRNSDLCWLWIDSSKQFHCFDPSKEMEAEEPKLSVNHKFCRLKKKITCLTFTFILNLDWYRQTELPHTHLCKTSVALPRWLRESSTLWLHRSWINCSLKVSGMAENNDQKGQFFR